MLWFARMITMRIFYWQLTFDNSTCSSRIWLLLCHIWLEHFIKHVDFALLKKIFIKKFHIFDITSFFSAQIFKNYYFFAYRNMNTLFIWKFDNELRTSFFLRVIQRPKSTHHSDVILCRQILIGGRGPSLRRWIRHLGTFQNFVKSKHSRLKMSHASVVFRPPFCQTVHSSPP